MKYQKAFRRSKGSSLTGYGLIVGLISILALGALSQTGEQVDKLFSKTAGSLGGAAQGGGASSSSPMPSASSSPQPSPEPPGTDPNCYDSGNLGQVGQSGWTGCENMLIVSQSDMQTAVSNTTYAITGPDSESYSFADGVRTIFTGQVTSMASLFQAGTFNQNIGHWDMSNVTNTSLMFHDNISFNQDIGDWDVTSITNLNHMFNGATSFNQDLSGWCIQSGAQAIAYDNMNGGTNWSLPRPTFNCTP